MAGRAPRGLACAAALLALGATAAPAADEPRRGVWSAVVENDLFDETDRDYTGGLSVTWLPADAEPPAWALAAARAIPWFPADGDARHGWSLGQAVFTPRDITLANPPPSERPYAAWLYGALGLGVLEDGRYDQVALAVGVVGPAALGAEAQGLFHSLTGSTEARGWHTQLDTEPVFVLGYQRTWHTRPASTPLGREFQLLPHLGGALGTVYAYADAGLTLRYGRGLDQDLGPPRIPPGTPGSAQFLPGPKGAWALFAGVEVRAMARNLFLDGNTFAASRRVDSEPWVGDFEWGFSGTLGDLRLTYAHVHRTREYRSQRHHEEFGVLTVSVGF